MRPNRDRTKTTVYLGAEDRERIAQIRRAFGENTDAGAIRRALQIATSPLEADLDLVARVLKWADGLAFRSPRETRELHGFSRDLYRIVCQRAASQMPSETTDAQGGNGNGKPGDERKSGHYAGSELPRNCDVFGVPPG